MKILRWRGPLFVYLWRFLPHLPNFVRLFWRLFWDRRVPIYLKGMVVVAVLYVLSPLDILPDYLPLIGQIDDLSLLLLAGYYFIRWSPTRVVAEHVATIDKHFGKHRQR
jgi:uncharacterized membrane protein YkvA (DUF1232 family)